MPGRLEGKTVVVTGASRGIGKGIALAFAKEGAALVLAGRDAAALVETAAAAVALRADAIAIPTDVTIEYEVARLFTACDERFGGVDVLVNNAGAFDGGRFEDLSVETWDHVMAVNLRGPFLCGREAFRRMIPRKSGRILNIGSISAQRPRHGAAPYATSKFGVQGLTQAMALDGREHGISVSCLHPGNVFTERRAQSGSPSDQEPMMSVEELAEVAVVMASLPPHVNLLEAIVLPVDQAYLGRG